MNGRAMTQSRQNATLAFTPVRGGLLQRACACGKHTGNGGECAECRQKREALQRAAVNPGPVNAAPPIVHDVLRSSGQPLDAVTRASMEPRFGHDFSQVRVHTDAPAGKSAELVNAYAYTVGQDIVFGPGQYAPHTAAGRSLLAHELSHVVQQGNQRISSFDALQISDSSEPAEHEADQVAKHEAEMPDSTDRAAAEDGAMSSPCHCGNHKKDRQSLPQVLESLLPTDRYERAKLMGKMFSEQAIGVDGNWLSANLDTGASLEPRVRSDMEDKFGIDLSKVRVHTDNNADLVAQTLNARAVTVGQHIAFARGEYDPDKESGRQLLIHELAHTVQQKNVSGLPTQAIPITRPIHSSEHEADAVVQSVAYGSSGQLGRLLSPVAAPQVSRSVCGIIVEASCWAAFSAIAAAIAALCAIGSVITVGGLAIPCTAVVIGAAGLAAWDAVMCTNILKEAICGEPIAAAETAPETSAPA